MESLSTLTRLPFVFHLFRLLCPLFLLRDILFTHAHLKTAPCGIRWVRYPLAQISPTLVGSIFCASILVLCCLSLALKLPYDRYLRSTVISLRSEICALQPGYTPSPNRHILGVRHLTLAPLRTATRRRMNSSSTSTLQLHRCFPVPP